MENPDDFEIDLSIEVTQEEAERSIIMKISLCFKYK